MNQRLVKGKALADAGAAVKHGDLWVVHGTARNYTVYLDGDSGATCACPDWHNRMKDAGDGGQCKHIIAAQITETRDRICQGVA